MKAGVALSVCQKCKAKCCKMGGPWFTEKEKSTILKAGHADYFVQCDEDFYELTTKNGICPYLDGDNSCSIHDKRPDMCKSWPVFGQFKEGQMDYTIAQCPLTPFLSSQDIELMKKQAGRIPTHLSTYSYAKSKLSQAEIKIIVKRFNKFKRVSLGATL